MIFAANLLAHRRLLRAGFREGHLENIMNSSHGVRRATTKTSHETRFVLDRYPAKILENKAFSLVGAPGLEPGTR
jgi:hypothetical protein